MKGLFIINIGVDDNGTYGATTLSMLDGQQNSAAANRLPALMKTVTARILKRSAHNRKFPPPEPSKIIKPNGFRAPKLVVPARN